MITLHIGLSPYGISYYAIFTALYIKNLYDSRIAPARFWNSNTVAQSWNSKIAQSDSRIVSARFRNRDYIGILKKHRITV